MECRCVLCLQFLESHWIDRVTVDNLHNTAGDIALSMNNESIYSIIRDAGIRSGTYLRHDKLHSLIG